MSTEENKALMQRIFKEVLNEGQIEKANELVADDYVYHGPGGHELTGVDSFKKLMAWFRDALPGVHYTLDDLVAEGDKVAIRFTAKGTDESTKQVEFQGMMICRVVDGKEAEAWDLFDRYTIASQLAPGWAKAILRLIESQMVKDRP
jgi:predicted ester cyclase